MSFLTAVKMQNTAVIFELREIQILVSGNGGRSHPVAISLRDRSIETDGRRQKWERRFAGETDFDDQRNENYRRKTERTDP